MHESASSAWWPRPSRHTGKGRPADLSWVHDRHARTAVHRSAHAAAVAVAEAPGTACNPLFICGGLRLGRTQLLHAIGNYAQELHPSLDIRYVRAAEFGRQFAIAAGDGQQDDLRSRHLDVGMLLVDDVQLLPDAEAIQAEFLHVVTTLHNGGRQLVISADRAPRLLAGLDDSLRDRLEGGLVAELANDTDGTA